VRKFVYLISFFIGSAQAAPVPFMDTLEVLSNPKTQNVLKNTDTWTVTNSATSIKYRWIKQDVLLGDGSVMRYCLILGEAEMQALPAIPPLHAVTDDTGQVFYTNADILSAEDAAKCAQ
jgi:hypothetical protein